MLRMAAKRPRFLGDVSIQTKMLIIVELLIVVPMLMLAIVGFIAAREDTANPSAGYLM